jgi:uncharacterized protein YcfJ
MGKSGRIATLCIALAIALSFTACNKTSPAPNDQQIVTSIQAKLFQDQQLKALPVTVWAHQGVVTLTGSVNAPLEKVAVEHIADHSAGVKQVVDNLSVAAGPSTQTSAANTPLAAKPEKTHARRHRRPAQRDREMAEAQSDPGTNAPQGPDQVPDSALSNAQENSQPPASPPPPSTKPASAAAASAAPAPAAAPAAQQPPPPPPPPEQITIPSGTAVSVRMIDGINSETAEPDQTYKASLAAPVVVGGQEIIPKDSNALVRVVQVQSAGHIQGQSELQVELIRVTVKGVRYKTESKYYTKLGQSRSKSSAEKIGGGAALGALLGGLLGRGAGAGIGAAIGAGAGTAAQEGSHGGQVAIPSESKINFVLNAPVVVTLSSTR